MSETLIFIFFQDKKTTNRTGLTSEKFTGKKTRDISRFFKIQGFANTLNRVSAISGFFQKRL